MLVKIVNKRVCFQVRLITVGNLGVRHKTTIVGDHQSLTYGIMHPFNIILILSGPEEL